MDGYTRGQSRGGCSMDRGVGVIYEWYGAERPDYTVFARVYLDRTGACE